MTRNPLITPKRRAEKMKRMIERAAVECGLNLTIRDGKIAFYDQKLCSIVDLWEPHYTAPQPYGRTNQEMECPGEALTKAEWLEVKDTMQTIGTMLSTSLLVANYDDQGQQDFESCRADFAAAVAAIEYVAEFAADKCRFIPIREDGQK